MTFVKSMNRIGGKFFYVVYRGDVWIAKIFYYRKSGQYEIYFENCIFKSEKSKVIKFCDKLNNSQ